MAKENNMKLVSEVLGPRELMGAGGDDLGLKIQRRAKELLDSLTKLKDAEDEDLLEWEIDASSNSLIKEMISQLWCAEFSKRMKNALPLRARYHFEETGRMAEKCGYLCDEAAVLTFLLQECYTATEQLELIIHAFRDYSSMPCSFIASEVEQLIPASTPKSHLLSASTKTLSPVLDLKRSEASYDQQSKHGLYHIVDIFNKPELPGISYVVDAPQPPTRISPNFGWRNGLEQLKKFRRPHSPLCISSPSGHPVSSNPNPSSNYKNHAPSFYNIGSNEHAPSLDSIIAFADPELLQYPASSNSHYSVLKFLEQQIGVLNSIIHPAPALLHGTRLRSSPSGLPVSSNPNRGGPTFSVAAQESTLLLGLCLALIPVAFENTKSYPQLYPAKTSHQGTGATGFLVSPGFYYITLNVLMFSLSLCIVTYVAWSKLGGGSNAIFMKSFLLLVMGSSPLHFCPYGVPLVLSVNDPSDTPVYIDSELKFLHLTSNKN